MRWAGLFLVALLAPWVSSAEPQGGIGEGQPTTPRVEGVRLEVKGSVLPTAEAIEVRLTFSNRGDAAATGVDVEGELLGNRLRGRLVAIPASEERVLLLRYPADVPRPGVHPLTLRTDYGTNSQGARASQCLFLLLALGATTEPPVSLTIGETRLDSYDPLVATVKSADAQAHRVRLRVVTPRGLHGGDAIRLEVPASGEVTARIPLLRAGAPRGSRQGILVIAEDEGSPARATVATAVVNVLPDPAWMPRLRWPLLALAVVLLVAAFVSEVRAGRRSLP